WHYRASHLFDEASDEVLLHLEVGNAVAQKPADPIIALEHGYVVPLARELLGSREPGGAGAHDRDLLPRPYRRHHRLHEPLFEGLIDDRALDVLDGDGLALDVEDARSLAGRRANATRGPREVVRRVQTRARVGQAALVRVIVEVGDDVPERAAVVTERDPAVHAPSGLIPELDLRHRQLELSPVLETFRDGALFHVPTLDLEKAFD